MFDIIVYRFVLSFILAIVYVESSNKDILYEHLSAIRHLKNRIHMLSVSQVLTYSYYYVLQHCFSKI